MNESETIRACVIGWPIGHSRSPLIHGHWLDKYRIDGTYEKRAVEPDALEGFIGSLAGAGYAGCNVTLPHKEATYRCVTVMDELTRRLKAVNTVFLEEGRPVGLNTDGYGFVTHLRASNPSWRAEQAPAVVLGAGGAARAAVASLLDAGVPELRLLNRTRERSDALMREFGGAIVVHDWHRRADVLADAGLLVNTTSLGMTGADPLDIVLDRLPDTATVYDIVYVPLMTPLLEAARARGNTVVDGLGMLLHQAVPGFEHWFGVRPEVTAELRAVIVADIEGRP